MIIVQLAGGLGNQMQQYALYRRFLSLGAEAELDASWFLDPSRQEKVLARRTFELERFIGLPMSFCTEEERERLTGTGSLFSRAVRKLHLKPSGIYAESEMYSEDLLSLRDAYLTGYFACEKYYAAILPDLRRDFVFPEASDAGGRRKNEEIRCRMKAEKEQGIIPVSIHLRRGDYLDPANSSLLGGICTDDYYRGAVEAVKQQTRSAEGYHFYIFSDDPAYAESLHFGSDGDKNTAIGFNSGEDAMLDIQLMSCCSANICANSTFSFWGARLNAQADRIAIRPSIHKNTQTFEPERMHDLWKGWLFVDRSGNIV